MTDEPKPRRASPAIFGFILAALMTLPFLYIHLLRVEPPKRLDTSSRELLRILFVGDTYTSVNDMPDIIKRLAESDPDAHFRVEIEVVAESDATLNTMFEDPRSALILAKKRWDYVILQPQSLSATHIIKKFMTNLALDKWEKAINKNGAVPVLFMTWPRQPGSLWYKPREDLFLKSPEHMYNRIKDDSIEIAQEHNMLIVPVGYYWMRTLEKHPELKLYNPDGSHPSQEGSFLAAALFYKMLVNATLDDLLYYPEYLSNKEKKAILEIINEPYPSELKQAR